MELQAARDAVDEALDRATERWGRLAGRSLCRLDGPDGRRLAAKEAEGATQALRLAQRVLRAPGDPVTLLGRARKDWLATPTGLGPDAEAYLDGGLAALDRVTAAAGAAPTE